MTKKTAAIAKLMTDKAAFSSAATCAYQQTCPLNCCLFVCLFVISTSLGEGFICLIIKRERHTLKLQAMEMLPSLTDASILVILLKREGGGGFLQFFVYAANPTPTTLSQISLSLNILRVLLKLQSFINKRFCVCELSFYYAT